MKVRLVLWNATGAFTATAQLAAIALLATSVLAVTGCGRPPGSLSNNNNNQNNGSERCPSGYVLVPGGTFTMGVNEEELADTNISWSPGMGPAHTVTLTSDFCMSQTEITVASYRTCRNGAGCTGDGPWPTEQDPGCNYSDTDTSRDDHPVNCITWSQAREYCQAQGGDLPTDAQWTRAAQGDDRRYYPWGNSEPDCTRANFDVNGLSPEDPNGYGCARTTIPPYTWPGGTAPAGASPYGVMDLAGNVAEFVLDCGGPVAECHDELGCVDPLNMDCPDDYGRYTPGGDFMKPWGMEIFGRGVTESNYSQMRGMHCVATAIDK